MTHQYYTDRRTVLKTIPATAVGSGVVTGTASGARGGTRRLVDDENAVEITAKHDEEADEHELALDVAEVSAGWTTFAFDNRTDHTHFVYFIKLPQSMLDAAAEADADVHDYYYEHATRPFQYLMDQIAPEKEPDPDDLSDKYSNPEEDVLFPPWLQEIQPSGGVGLTSGHTASSSTLDLAPGEYFLECYVKDDDDEEFHSYNGMSAVLSVTDERSGEEPEATIDISLASAETGEDEAPMGTMDVQGDVRAGQHTVAVHYEDQQAYENLGGHDVHLVRLDAETSLDDVNGWMNWMEPGQLVSDGSEPGTFLGGVHEIFTPELLGTEGEGGDGDGSGGDGSGSDGSKDGSGGDGSEDGENGGVTAYFHVDLNPGAYAVVSEVPDPRAKGLVETFSVTFDDVPAIDPVFGYPTLDAADVPQGLEPDHEVQMLAAPPANGRPPFLFFEPSGVHVAQGDVVQFTAVTPDHTVTAYHPGIGPDRRVPEASPPFSSPVLGPGSAWLYRFEHEGVYDVYCAPHHILGMAMRLVVGDLAEADLPDYVDSVEGVPSQADLSRAINSLSEENEDCQWPFVMPADIYGTDALDPMHVQDAGTVSFGAVAGELGYEFEPPQGGGEDDGGNDGSDDGGGSEGGDGHW